MPVMPPRAQLLGSGFGQEESYLYLGEPSAPAVGRTAMAVIAQIPTIAVNSFKYVCEAVSINFLLPERPETRASLTSAHAEIHLPAISSYNSRIGRVSCEQGCGSSSFSCLRCGPRARLQGRSPVIQFRRRL